MHSELPLPARYEIRERLGSGAMGVVYRVLDRETGAEVALKGLHRRDADDLYLLKHEFRSLATITHRNLVQLFDLEIGEHFGLLTMELVHGVDFRTALCGGEAEPTPDYERLAAAFGELAAGLAALHDRGKLHRDVKPGNVLVEPDGRVVLLDFGFVLDLERELASASQGDGFAGTLLYTSPEQAWGQRIGPAADWYSAGVLLYECLCGRLPFEGPGLGGLLDRQHRPPRRPREWVPAVPEHLDRLAMDLLSYEPAHRPRAAEVLARLAARELIRAPASAPTDTFVGREAEFERLASAFAATREGRCAVARVAGPSGIGKTSLVERFVEPLERKRGATVLRSRCHPQESVSFEAVDGLIDGLSEVLLRETPEALDALRPRGLPALVRVFPVLARVPFPQRAGMPGLADADPQEIRRRAFVALRELLARIADRGPLVLWADDVQWGGRDSAPLLRELVRAPDPPALLLILSYRSEDRATSPLLRVLAESDGEPSLLTVDEIVVPPLAGFEAESLLRSLLPAAGPALATELARDARGSPFLLGEIARYVDQRGSASGELPDLRDVIGERMRALPDDAQRLLELVAISGRPIATRLLLEVAGNGGAARGRVYELCNSCLLRAAPTGDELETYHARVREAVLGRLSDADRRMHHRELAIGLAAQATPDPQAVLEQWLGAGEEEAAAPHASAAAEQAETALAFDRAADLFDLAFRLRGASDSDFRLLARRAAALENAGRPGLSARAFSAAAAAAQRSGSRGATRLRGSAAEQHLFAGELAQARELLQSVLHDLGVAMPPSRAAATRSALALRARFLLRGSRFRARPAEELPAATLERLDVLHRAARGASMLDHTLSDALGARHLVEALALGEPSHALRALGLEAGFEANFGGAWFRRRSERLLREVRALAEITRDPFDLAWAEYSRSMVSWFRGEWRACVEHGTRAVGLLEANFLGVRWFVAANGSLTLSSLAQLGRFRELRERLAALLDDARRRGDAYALSVLRTGDPMLAYLAQDDAAAALRELSESGQEWTGGAFHSQHFAYTYGRVQTDLYRGDVWGAWSRLEQAWPALRSAGFLTLDAISCGLRHLRARTAIAAAELGGSPAAQAQWSRPRLASVAVEDLRRISRSTLPHASALVASIEAALAGLHGDGDVQREKLELATQRFTAVEMLPYALAAQRQLARLSGDSASVAAVEGRLRAEGVTDPAAICRLFGVEGTAG